jgi:hypothetical protein
MGIVLSLLTPVTIAPAIVLHVAEVSVIKVVKEV